MCVTVKQLFKRRDMVYSFRCLKAQLHSACGPVALSNKKITNDPMYSAKELATMNL